MWTCMARDLEQCETCKHNIENQMNPARNIQRPMLNEDGTDCADHEPVLSAGQTDNA